MYSSLSQNLGTLNVFAYDGQQNSSNYLWSLQYSQGKDWKEGKFTYRLEKKHQIIFEGIKGQGRGDIALDDITLSFTNCGFGPSEAQLPNITTTTRSSTTRTYRPTGQNDCTFEQGLCIWKRSNDSDFDWMRVQGLYGESIQGPIQYDHTLGESNGWYLFANSSHAANASNVAHLETDEVFGPSLNEQCMEFYYYFSTNSKFDFNIRRRTYNGRGVGITGQPIWTRSNSQGEFWKLGRVTLRVDLTLYAVLLELTNVQNGTLGDKFGIDDIYFTQGACKDGSSINELCTFENDTCGYSVDTKSQFQWQLYMPTDFNIIQLIPDHSTGATGTGYLFAVSNGFGYNETALFKSKTYNPASVSNLNDADRCLEFYFYLMSKDAMRLDVSLVTQSNKNLIWSRAGEHVVYWWKGEVNVKSLTDYSIAFEAVVGKNPDDGFLSIDDIILRDGRCSRLGFTSFEIGLYVRKRS